MDESLECMMDSFDDLLKQLAEREHIAEIAEALEANNPELATTLIAHAQRKRQARATLARYDRAAFASYVLRDEETLGPITMAPYHTEWHDLIEHNRRLIIWAHFEAGKALAINTPIPTPDGWRTMAALEPGDRVFGRDGYPCMVRAVSPVRLRQTFAVRFDDGVVIFADGDHQWAALSIDDVKSRRSPRVVTTNEMRTRLRRGPNLMWRVPVAQPVEYPEADLPVHPYVLGAWLGDGCRELSKLTCHVNDREIVDRCVALEGGVKGKEVIKGNTLQVGGNARTKRDPSALSARLRRLGVLKDKHVPAQYLTASVEQRTELLMGLMDTDGTVDGRRGRGRVSFANTNREIANGVLELAASLGYKPSMRHRQVSLSPPRRGGRKLDGERKSDCYVVAWDAHRPVFRLRRKLARQVLRPRPERGRTVHRTVVSIEPIGERAVKCITVDSEDSTYLAGRAYVPTHNTQQISIAEPLRTLGEDPTQRVVVVSATGGAAGTSTKIAQSLAKYIKPSNDPGSRALHDVYPDLVPGDQWSPNAGLLSIKRPGAAKDYSIQSVGVHGAILGTRIDLLILDDVLTLENTRTPMRRADVLQWIRTTLLTRVTPRGRVIIIGNSWHPEDAMYLLAKSSNWVSKKYPVRAPDGTLAWPERWPPERIAEYERDLGPLESARMLYCEPRSDADARFKEAWIIDCCRRGDGLKLRRDVTPSSPMPPPEPPARRWTGVDLGVGDKEPDALTAILTGESVRGSDNRVRHTLLDIESGRWDVEEILRRVIAAHLRFGSTLIVEAVAAQKYLVRFIELLTADRVPVLPFMTNKNKWHAQYGVEGIAAEMSQGLWTFPSMVLANGDIELHPEVAALMDDMRYFDPLAHTGDRLMGLWFLREAACGRVRKHRVAEAVPPGRSMLTEEEQAKIVSVGRKRLPARSDIPKNAKARRKVMRDAQRSALWDGLRDELGWDD